MKRTVAEKMGITEGTRSHVSHAPEDALASMALPVLDFQKILQGEYGYIHLFVKSRVEMDREFPKLKAHLSTKGSLWLSWPKNRQLGTDLTLAVVIELGYSYGLVESTVMSINDTWSAIKFTHPKPGKAYDNRYGTLPGGSSPKRSDSP